MWDVHAHSLGHEGVWALDSQMLSFGMSKFVLTLAFTSRLILEETLNCGMITIALNSVSRGLLFLIDG